VTGLPPVTGASGQEGAGMNDMGHGDGQDQRMARAFAAAVHGAARAVRLYPAENAAVQKALQELRAAAARVAQTDGECTLRRVGDFLFVNETRLRLTLDNFAAVGALGAALRDAGTGGFTVHGAPTGKAWIVLLAAMQEPFEDEDPETRGEELARRLAAAHVDAFELLPPADDHEAADTEMDSRERARQTYVRSLDVTRDVISAARIGRSPGLKRVKRAVQGIVDAILTDTSSIMGLTTLREFDDYTFVHSVNVCILSVALGRRIGLTRVQLLDLGLGALLHDIGKSRVPLETLNKRGSLDDADIALLRTHPWQGVLALCRMPFATGRPWRAMVAAHEHHRKIDQSGYPSTRGVRPLSLFSKIIAVADGYDAATTTRVYQSNPWSPADVLRGMRDNPRLGLDPVIVKAFINLTGIYPVGTVVVLDSFELAVVHTAHTETAGLSRPIVRLVSDAQGNRLPDGPLCDLTARDEHGQFLRTIIRTEDPERYGIRVGDHLA
jgi:HD-GYP domain-containing protein (c-di-GMP phosphodiesterase class II)